MVGQYQKTASKKEVKIGPPYCFHVLVKFYSSKPNNLHEDLTQYLLVLQLKQDVLSEELEGKQNLTTMTFLSPVLNLSLDSGYCQFRLKTWNLRVPTVSAQDSNSQPLRTARSPVPVTPSSQSGLVLVG